MEGDKAMKKRMLSVLLCLSMAVSMLAGCSSKDANTTNENATDNNSAKKKDEAVDVSKKLEKQYVKRIEAYQEYFDEIREKYSEYEFGATITLDKDGLPLFWLCMGEPDSWDDTGATQLIGYEKKKAAVLAEKGGVIFPYRGPLIMAQGSADDENYDDDEDYEYREDPIYLYDEENRNFVTVTDELRQSYNVNDVTNYSEKELNEKADRLAQLLECTNFFETIRVAKNDAKHQAVYLGRNHPDYYCLALVYLNAFFRFSGGNSTMNIGLREEYAGNKKVFNYFENLADAKLDQAEKDTMLHNLSLNEQAPRIYDSIIKVSPDEYILPDGTIGTDEEITDYTNKLRIFMEGSNWEYEYGEAGEYFDELATERILRELQKKPIFSQEELYTYLVSVAYDCEIIDADLEDCIIKNASNDFICGIVQGYIEGGDSVFVTDEMISNRDSLLNTEPYKIISDAYIEDSYYENNVETLHCTIYSDEDDYDNASEKEYQFQIEFNETGDKISKIEYIDPYANLPEWKKVYLNQLDMSQVWYPSLADINDDGVPEIVACGDESGASDCWGFYYIDKSNNVLYLPGGISKYNSEKIYISGGRYGNYYDIVYVYDTSTGVYDIVFDGSYEYDYAGEGNRPIQYHINDKDVSEKEYEQKVDDITADITNEYNGFENFSEDTDITDLIMNY